MRTQREPSWRVLPPRGVESGGAEPELDPAQRTVVELPAGHGPVLVLGAPGTGRSTVTVGGAVRRIVEGADPQRLLVLAPSRELAATLRDEISRRARATISTPLVRAWQAYAFDVLRRAQAQDLLPGVTTTPVLLSGPEQDAFLAEMMRGHAAGYGSPVVWPAELDQALGTRGFRGELRELFDRMNEYRLAPDVLARWAQPLGRPEWRSAAAFRAEYQQIRALRMPNAFDPSELVDRAARVLEENPDFLAREQDRLDVVLVDDLQDATPSAHRLIGVLTRGRDAVFTANPDTTVQGFRGARPDLLRTLEDRVGTPARPLQRLQLGTSHRMPLRVNEAWQRVARAISVVPGARVHRAPEQPRATEHIASQAAHAHTDDDLHSADDAAAPGSVRAALFDSPTAQARWCADHFLRLHVLHGVPYRDMAVIVRSGSQLSALTRQLSALGVPTTTSAAETPLREEPAVIPLLHALRLLLAAQDAVAESDGALDQEAQGAAPGRDGQPGDDPDSGPETAVEGSEADAEDVGRRSEAGVEGAGLTAETDSEGAGSDSEDAEGERAAHRSMLTASAAVALLTSRIGGASPMEVRRIRQKLRGYELRTGGGRTSDDLLVQALADGVLLELAEVHSDSAARVADMLQAGQEALDEPGATAESVLWALWDASGVAPRWRRRALAGGAEAVRADRDLDAVVGLFEAAERFVDQVPGATARAFMDYMDHQELPMDTLAARAPAEDNVSVMTPAGSAGRQWAHVVVAGVQQGVWPNTALRGQLLGTDVLTDALDHGPEQATRLSAVDRLRQVRFDELRQFATAVSRATAGLTVTAVASQDEQPSEFVDLVAGGSRDDPGIPIEELSAPEPLTLRQLTGALRRTVQQPDAAAHEREAAARLLHDFAALAEPVPGAAPEQWWGRNALSTENALFAPDEAVRVSPSKIETIHRSPLDWFVSEAHATEVTDLRRSLGTLVHDIAEHLPDADSVELIAHLRRRWPSLGMPHGWTGEQERERAEKMLRKFAQYSREMRSEHGRELVSVEGSFEVLVRSEARDALLTGRVDRLEVDAHGRHVVVDLKTGKHQPTKKDIPEHPQLGAYQVALQAGAGRAMQEASRTEDLHEARRPERIELPEGAVSAQPGGALLVQLGGPAASPGVQLQDPLDEEHRWARDLITQAALLVAGTRFEARHTADQEAGFGIRCSVPWLCPLCAQGRQVTEK
ncbi:ATP-dependent DNA helicase [Kocuria marina]|uniref:ATP-dependent DNA helicase n=1 Tax=Kocuria marina TaxID=223184 RepID=UPI0021A29249|nr:ATP-dependent DNA helicase [Kocuria marina]MCT1615828.1 ATP-dependent helicase [Kocuria marina]